MHDSPSRIALVIPVYNESGAAHTHLSVIRDQLLQLPNYQFQILVVDDGSQDDTVVEVQALADTWQTTSGAYCEHPVTLSLLCLTRNFGKEAAIQAGLEHLSHDIDAVIVMDSDLQHPPALIPEMLTMWERGIPVIEAHKRHRGVETRSSQWFTKGFYRLFNLLSGMDLTNHSDYKLLDRCVLDAFHALQERDRFFRGLVPWLGFTSARIPFDVPPRTSGQSRWPKLRLWRYSLSAITSFSSAPLQFITLLGVLTFIMSVLVAGKVLYDKAVGEALGGFTTVILLQLVIGSALMISLGLLGAYVAKIHDEVKRRPSYFIDRRNSRLPPSHPHDNTRTPLKANGKGRPDA